MLPFLTCRFTSIHADSFILSGYFVSFFIVYSLRNKFYTQTYNNLHFCLGFTTTRSTQFPNQQFHKVFKLYTFPWFIVNCWIVPIETLFSLSHPVNLPQQLLTSQKNIRKKNAWTKYMNWMWGNVWKSLETR